MFVENISVNTFENVDKYHIGKLYTQQRYINLVIFRHSFSCVQFDFALPRSLLWICVYVYIWTVVTHDGPEIRIFVLCTGRNTGTYFGIVFVRKFCRDYMVVFRLRFWTVCRDYSGENNINNITPIGKEFNKFSRFTSNLFSCSCLLLFSPRRCHEVKRIFWSRYVHTRTIYIVYV